MQPAGYSTATLHTESISTEEVLLGCVQCDLILWVRRVGLLRPCTGRTLDTKEATCWTNVKTMNYSLAGDIYGA